MYKILCILLLGLLFVDATYAEPAGSTPPYLKHSLSSTGLGPVKIGMTVKKASAALGAKLLPGVDTSRPGFLLEEHNKCHFVTPEAKDIGLAFMVQDGVITRIDVSNSHIKTLSGLKIGSTTAHIKSRYGKSLRTKQHKSGSADDEYLFARVSSKNEIVFEIVKGKVVRFRSGLAGAVAAGCL